jgi:organic radical activating enzyme
VSAESGSDRVLNQIVEKDLRLCEVERVATQAHTAEIPLLVHFMIGLPGETPEEVNETLRFAARLCVNGTTEASVQYATPLPGTRLSRVAADTGCRVLPAIEDYGPCFQQHPPMDTQTVSRATLARFGGAWRSHQEARRSPEVHISLHPRCNNRCSFCSSPIRRDSAVRPGTWVETLRSGRSRGARSLFLGGGEPTLSPALFPLVDLARRLGYERVTLTTNGRMASYGEYASRLAESGLTTILVKLPAPDARTHAALTETPGAFEQTTTGLRHLLTSSPAGVEIGVTFGVSKRNLSLLDEITELAFSLGVRSLRAHALVSAESASRSLEVADNDLGPACRALALTHGQKMSLRFPHVPFCLLNGFEALVEIDPLVCGPSAVIADPGTMSRLIQDRAPRRRRPICSGCPEAIVCAGFREGEHGGPSLS